MQKGFYGFRRAIISTIVGLVITLATREIVSEFTKNENLGIIAAFFVFTISLYAITSDMKYWGIVYTIFWMLGLGLMYYSLGSLVEWYEIILYLAISGIILYGKFENKF